jgi:hypothetical protein
VNIAVNGDISIRTAATVNATKAATTQGQNAAVISGATENNQLLYTTGAIPVTT